MRAGDVSPSGQRGVERAPRSCHSARKPWSARCTRSASALSLASSVPCPHHQGVVVELAPAQAEVEQAEGADVGGTAAQRVRLVAEPTHVGNDGRMLQLTDQALEITQEVVDQALEEAVAAVELGQARDPRRIDRRSGLLPGRRFGTRGRRGWGQARLGPRLAAARELGQGAQQQLRVDRLGEIGREADALAGLAGLGRGIRAQRDDRRQLVHVVREAQQLHRLDAAQNGHVQVHQHQIEAGNPPGPRSRPGPWPRWSPGARHAPGCGRSPSGSSDCPRRRGRAARGRGLPVPPPRRHHAGAIHLRARCVAPRADRRTAPGPAGRQAGRPAWRRPRRRARGRRRSRRGARPSASGQAARRVLRPPPVARAP